MQYAYNRLGEVRYTIDQNGTSHAYARDLNGRVTADVAAVDTNGPIDDAIDRITVDYDDFGRPTLVQSHSGVNVWNSVEYVYTVLGQIATIRQENFGAIDGSTPEVTYTWDVQNAANGNYARMDALEYPSASMLLEGVYDISGSPPSADNLMSRLRQLKYDDTTVAQYDYVGLAQPVVVAYPEPDVLLDYFSAHDGTTVTGQYAGLDRYGRPRTHKWVDGTYGNHGTETGYPNRPPVVETAYVYDAASNILAKYDARPGAQQSLNHEYEYDDLHRLIEAARGAGDNPVSAGEGTQTWSLDVLGNHLEVGTDLNDDGTISSNDDLIATGEFDLINQVDDLETTTSGGSPEPPIVVAVVASTCRVHASVASTIATRSPAAARGLARMAASTTMLSLSATPMRPNVPRIVLKLIGKPIDQVESSARPSENTATHPSMDA